MQGSPPYRRPVRLPDAYAAGSWSKLKAKKRHRRIDQDVRQHLVADAVQKGGAVSAYASRVGARVVQSTAQGWIHQHVRQHLADCWDLAAKPLGLVSTAEDGARFGQPAKENQVYAVWITGADAGLWLPQQAADGKYL